LATIVFLIVLLTMTFFKLMIQGLFLIHRLQQLGYYNLKFVTWLEGSQYRRILLWNIFELLAPLLVIMSLFFTIKVLPQYKYITSTIMVATFLWKLIHPFISGWIGPLAVVKKPLIYTARVKRLIISLTLETLTMLLAVVYFTAMPLDTFTLSTRGFFKLNAFLLFLSVITPVLVLVANLINTPLEKLIHYYYFIKAKRTIARLDSYKIAITGSYGKTSTKFFLTTILKEKFRAFCTPESYNTPMGICKIVNTTDLTQYEMFVIEMGADHYGDINTLCRLAKPDAGIVTAIDLQHLSTFGSEENIIETKLSLIQNVKPGGFGLVNYDSKRVKDNLNRFNYPVQVHTYSIKKDLADNATSRARDIRHTREGLEFTAIPRPGREIPVKTMLLGRHNVLNLLAAITMAVETGMSNEEIQAGIAKIKPVEHRLQPVHSPNGVLILDDAFNANLAGAKEAVNVCAEIDGGSKIIITPGLIELGDREIESNIEFGRHMSEHLDYIILVGESQTKPIQDSILETTFPKNHLFVVNSLKQAQNVLAGIVKKGDVVLFENDLPDTFNE
jgi:UDP-N-acetylmuramoyl-tripeptide--D-alanyl-D-alanine ligase